MKHIPERMCVACRTMCPQNELIRIVKDKETGKISLDMNKKLMGRGAYICKKPDCVNLARKKRGIERQLKCAVPDGIYEDAMTICESSLDRLG